MLVTTLSAEQAFARCTVVKVSLWDKGATSMNMLGHGDMMGMAMGIRVSSQTVSAGDVTFEVSNLSPQMVQEMAISPAKDSNTPLPYDKAGNKVDEDAAWHLGEVAELEPGMKGALRLNLKPGKYILYCNVPGHYALGMWTLLIVKG